MTYAIAFNRRIAGLALLAVASAILVGATSLAGSRASAATAYDYVARGAVDAINTSTNTLTITGTWANTSDGRKEIQSKQRTYSIVGANVYKWENGVKVQRNIHHIKLGDEVVFQGTRSASGSFSVTRVTVNERDFEIVGRVKSINTDTDTLTVLVGRSTYHHSSYQNTKITLSYTSETKCYRLGEEIGCDNVAASDQGIKVRGRVTADRTSWDITHAWDKYPI